MARLLIVFLTLAALLLGFVFWFVMPVFAHDDLDWITQQGLRNKAGEWCCGRGDCEAIRNEDVKPVDGGYYIVPLKEFIPQHETLPLSPGGAIRCCRPDGSRRCFIVEPQGF